MILERAIRMRGIDFAALALKLNVKPRTIYHWVKSEKLSSEVFIFVGAAIKHDFTLEVPDFAKETNHPNIVSTVDKDWWDKYLRLLEEYANLVAINSVKVLPN